MNSVMTLFQRDCILFYLVVLERLHFLSSYSLLLPAFENCKLLV